MLCLFTFHKRLFDRLLFIAHFVPSYENYPPNFKKYTNFEICKRFALFPRMMLKLKIVHFLLNSQAFKIQINIVPKKIQKKFTRYFPIFGIDISLAVRERL